MLFAAEFQLNKDIIHHNRTIYTFFDVLGDIGGLFDALLRISHYIVLILFKIFGNPMHEYLLEHLFLRNPKQKSDNGETKLTNNRQKVEYLHAREPFKL